MSIVKDADYVKLNYKNSQNTYENLTPAALMDNIKYNKNDIVLNVSGKIFRNNIQSENVTDALNEIVDNVAQCGRIFEELEFGVEKDIDVVDGDGHQITLNTYYIGNIVYFPKTQKHYMLLYSFVYNRSVLLCKGEYDFWENDSENTGVILVDMKCNSQNLYFSGYYSSPSSLIYLFKSETQDDILNNISLLQGFEGAMSVRPQSQYELSVSFPLTFDMDENSLLCCCGYKELRRTEVIGFTIDTDGSFFKLESKTLDIPIGNSPNLININHGQYIYSYEYYTICIISMSNSSIKTYFIKSEAQINSITLIGEPSYNIALCACFNDLATTQTLRQIVVVTPNDAYISGTTINVLGFSSFLLLAKRCCRNFISYSNATNKKRWQHNISLSNNTNSVPLVDTELDIIGENYNIQNSFNPSFINKINNNLFIYINNEVNSTTLNNSKLYISQIKI